MRCKPHGFDSQPSQIAGARKKAEWQIAGRSHRPPRSKLASQIDNQSGDSCDFDGNRIVRQPSHAPATCKFDVAQTKAVAFTKVPVNDAQPQKGEG